MCNLIYFIPEYTLLKYNFEESNTFRDSRRKFPIDIKMNNTVMVQNQRQDLNKF